MECGVVVGLGWGKLREMDKIPAELYIKIRCFTHFSHTPSGRVGGGRGQCGRTQVFKLRVRIGLSEVYFITQS